MPELRASFSLRGKVITAQVGSDVTLTIEKASLVTQGPTLAIAFERSRLLEGPAKFALAR